MQWIFALIFTLFLGGCATKVDYSPQTYEQFLPTQASKTLTFIAPNPESFLQYYYKPWNGSLHVNKSQALWPWNVYKPANKFYGQNLKPRSQDWFDKQLTNASLENIGEISSNAIMLKTTDVRVFPTHLPIFRNPETAGEGFPFDYGQNSLISAFSPVWLSHYSADKMWAFIEADSFFGWVRAWSILPLGHELQNEFINAPKVVAVNPFNLTHEKGFYTTIPVGTLLPLDEDGNIFAYLPNGDKISLLAKDNDISQWPIEFKEQSVLKLGMNFLDEPYGWGGMFGNRDCSAMTKDFFAPFGIWLPRNSKAQFNQGSHINLEKLKPQEKEQMIKKYAIPFMSLIYLPGHIMLYGGNLDGKPLVLHNTWGIKTITDGKEGRHIIGKAIFSDLHVGSEHPQADQNAALITKIQAISTPSALSPKERLQKAYPRAIKEISNNRVLFYSGVDLPFSTGETLNPENILDNIDIQGQFIQPYPTLTPLNVPTHDPGRFRNEDFFKALYGGSKEDIEKELISVKWLPNHTNKTLLFHSKHGAANALQRVSNELDKLPRELLTYVNNPAGTYNYRKIAGTNRLSMHSFGIAIDINTENGDYWRWSKSGQYQNKIPQEIVRIFESNGFIWGGRWKHFDTFHFEYRPELTLP